LVLRRNHAAPNYQKNGWINHSHPPINLQSGQKRLNHRNSNQNLINKHT
jgi:hypothetical protein